MNKKFPKKWSLGYSAVMMFFFSVLIQFVLYFIQGEFNVGFIVGAFLGTAPMVLINILYVRRKKNSTPEIDERTRRNVLKFIAYASQILFLVLMILLTIITFIGIDNIPTLYLWGIVLLNMFVIGVGSMVVLRK